MYTIQTIVNLNFLPSLPKSLTQLSDMSENEDVLLEFFVSLPQLKQVTGDKEDLVSSIVEMASEFLFCQSLRIDCCRVEFYSKNKTCESCFFLQKRISTWSHSWREKDKRCFTRSASGCRCLSRLSLSSCSRCAFCPLFFAQYEQLTQMKLAFETKMQRQHELSEVNRFTHHARLLCQRNTRHLC